MIALDDRPIIDRTEVEYPNDLQLTPFIAGLTAPCAIGFEASDERYKGSVVIAESGGGRFNEPQIVGFLPNGESFPIYPRFTRIPLLDEQFRIIGPIGGMALANGKIYITHRDENDRGVITALDYDGHHTTIVADLPAMGDFGLTDIAVHPSNGRLYFGLGAATNSGVVGMDNWEVGWVEDHPDAADRPYTAVKLNGYRFTTPNPKGGLFGGDDIAVTAPFQAFGTSKQLRIPAPLNGKPTAAIYSVNIDGGDLRVEAHGLRLPRGLVFNEFGNLFASNNGMELRGTRPVKDDPDAVLRVPLGGQIWYGFPDFSTDLVPIGDARFQPPSQLLMRTGYPELATLVDHEASGLIPPDQNTLMRGRFAPLSGAAKMAFVPDQPAEPFKPFRGQLVVALSGDRSPFATGGQKLVGPQGFQVKAVDLDTKRVSDFVVNTRRMPASQNDKSELELERPIDVKFGPDGALYIVDYGRMEMKNGHERIESKTGRVFRLGPPAIPSTSPATPAPPTKPKNFAE
ncbi:MAG: repeat containing protein [Phycisphaerales bacterium]|nr:repeat containing protein [Phycisphaerales bacterium]